MASFFYILLDNKEWPAQDVSVPPHTEGVCGGGLHRMCQFPLTRREGLYGADPENETASSSFWE